MNPWTRDVLTDLASALHSCNVGVIPCMTSESFLFPLHAKGVIHCPCYLKSQSLQTLASRLLPLASKTSWSAPEIAQTQAHAHIRCCPAPVPSNACFQLSANVTSAWACNCAMRAKHWHGSWSNRRNTQHDVHTPSKRLISFLLFFRMQARGICRTAMQQWRTLG